MSPLPLHLITIPVFVSSPRKYGNWQPIRCQSMCHTWRSVCPLKPQRCLSVSCTHENVYLMYITYPGNLCTPSHLPSVSYFVIPIVCPYYTRGSVCPSATHNGVTGLLNIWWNVCHPSECVFHPVKLKDFLSHSTHSINLSSLLHLEITFPSVASKVNVYFWVGLSSVASEWLKECSLACVCWFVKGCSLQKLAWLSSPETSLY